MGVGNKCVVIDLHCVESPDGDSVTVTLTPNDSAALRHFKIDKDTKEVVLVYEENK